MEVAVAIFYYVDLLVACDGVVVVLDSVFEFVQFIEVGVHDNVGMLLHLLGFELAILIVFIFDLLLVFLGSSLPFLFQFLIIFLVVFETLDGDAFWERDVDFIKLLWVRRLCEFFRIGSSAVLKSAIGLFNVHDVFLLNSLDLQNAVGVSGLHELRSLTYWLTSRFF